MNKTLTASSLALALSAALTVAAAPVAAADGKMAMEMDHCYGVALKGKNDCKGKGGCGAKEMPAPEPKK